MSRAFHVTRLTGSFGSFLVRRGFAATLAVLCAANVFAVDSEETRRAKLKFFENEIRPLLAARCYECHGEKKQKAGLRLDHISRALSGGESGAALVAGDVEASLLIKAIRYKDEELQMPPDDPLPAAEVALLEKWVAMGAPWPDTEVAPRVARDEHGFTAEDRAFWVFQPVAKAQPPEVTSKLHQTWATTALDRFVAAKHVEHGLEPAPRADRRELVRRVYFDVHGLPPTPAQIETFVNDDAPGAYARLIDGLLASPRYGERWAQHWLDLVRFAESDGYRADAFRPAAWPYRDYVIESFNSDKPYDQFVREQLAGDEIAPDKPEVLVATSYLRNPIYEWNQRDVRGQAEFIVNDLTENAGEVFLGLSMGCARCHDHKFDPILQKDFYRLRAFFEPVWWRDDLMLATAEGKARYAAQLAKWEAATAALRAQRDELGGAELANLVKKAYAKFTPDLQAMIDKPVAERTAEEHILGSLAARQIEYEHERFDPLKALKTTEAKLRYREIETALKKFDHLKPKPLTMAFVATDAGPKAPPTKMKTKKGEQEIAPGFLTLLEPTAPEISPRSNSTGRRKALADWITRPDNPLSARVIVNRVWQHHFGRGIAGTPNDLGRLGDRPTHPELLDWLTRRFVDGGWKLKALHREILLSATYQQTARHTSETAQRVDPANRYLWRYSPRRLDAEQARDAILAATGELDLRAGGPSQDGNTSLRRSIYISRKRNNPNEVLRALDAPAGFTSIADRQQTATPLQALLFMNGDWLIARARQLAVQAASPTEAWRATLGREPNKDEARLAAEFLAQRIAAEQGLPDSNGEKRVDLNAGLFQESTAQERLIVRDSSKEGDEFTIEAILTLESVDAGTAVRTIASRWNGEKSSIDAHGWSLGVTGEKSGYKPRNLILQLVGEDENMDTTYEVVPSGIHLELRKTYHLVVRVACADRSASFSVRDLAQPDAAARTVTVKHAVTGKLGTSQATLVVGGLMRRSPHQFDGRISAVRVVSGGLTESEIGSNPTAWKAPTLGGMMWHATQPLAPTFAWAGGAANVESTDPRARAMADLAHVLLNSNEFIYLH